MRTMRLSRALSFVAVGAVSAALLVGCTSAPSGTPPTAGASATDAGTTTSAPAVSSTPQHPTPPITTPTVVPTPTATQEASTDPIAKLSMAQRVGQLFMVGTTAVSAQTVTKDALTDRHVGNVFLSGRSTRGAAGTARVVRQFTKLVNDSSTGGVPLWVATDQEGGQVQVLQGSGFDTMPTGLQQGALPPYTLRADAQSWGRELAGAGLNMNLAPVVDLLPSAARAAGNPPIGAFKREYGFTTTVINQHADAFRSGMEKAGVQTVMKHFPGLGYVRANTDTTANVKDTVTTATSPSVDIYAHGIAKGATAVMVSSAIYTRIDKTQPAVFSSRVVTDLLRTRLGFDGVIMTDDVSAAQQVQHWSPAERAIKSISAGVDIVLVSADPSVAAPMVDAVLAKAKSDQKFAKLVDGAARRVVSAKNASL